MILSKLIMKDTKWLWVAFIIVCYLLTLNIFSLGIVAKFTLSHDFSGNRNQLIPLKSLSKVNHAVEKWLSALLFTPSKTPMNPAGIYLFKVNNRNTRTRCEICSKLTIKTPERRQWLASLLLTLNIFHTLF